MDELNIYVPLLSRAGKYDKKPLIDGYGQIEAYISFDIAERAGMRFIDKESADEVTDLMLHIGTFTVDFEDESLAEQEEWYE